MEVTKLTAIDSTPSSKRYFVSIPQVNASGAQKKTVTIARQGVTCFRARKGR